MYERESTEVHKRLAVQYVKYHYIKITVVRVCVRAGVHWKQADPGAKSFAFLQS